MDKRFNKNELPFLEKLANNCGTARDYYWLGRKQKEQKYYSFQNDRVTFALQLSAFNGDEWGMYELGSILINDPVRLPEGLSWLYRSVRAGNDAARKLIYDKWSDIYVRVMEYNPQGNSEYANIEVKCAMLTAMLLIYFGTSDWNSLSEQEKIWRVNDLSGNICKIYGIPVVKIEFEPNLSTDIYPFVDGLAYFGMNYVKINSRCLYDFSRLIQVIYHEVGHHVVYAMVNENTPNRDEVFKRFGVTYDRVQKWKNNEIGYAITIGEEDPDTLSYGVWWTYYLYFPK